jgi:hypothetical protein
MRYQYYFHALGQEKSAMQYYAGLQERQALYCWDCAGYCEKACPYGVQVRLILPQIHDDLTINYLA